MYETIGEKDTRFIIVTGGVCSSIGKGVLVSSLGFIYLASLFKLMLPSSFKSVILK